MRLIPLFLLISCIAVHAQTTKKIAVEDYTTRQTFSPRSVSGINWMKDGKFYTALQQNKVVRYDITTGQAVETLLDGSAFSPSLEIDGYSFSFDENKVLLRTDYQGIYRRSYTAEYFVYDRTTKALEKLSNKGRQSYATFSPDGMKVAFVRDNNLFYTDLAGKKETQVTNDGKFNFIINGSTDWVYEEEFGFVTAFFWSPDSKRLAFYRFDETEVKEYNLQKWNEGQLYPQDYRFKYPKAGEKNSTVTIWLYDLASGQKTQADIGNNVDMYVPRVKWSANPLILSVRKLNRLQNTFELVHVDASSGKGSVVLSEKSETYVDIEALDDLTYLKDGKSFIHASESDGYKHLYLYDMHGKLIRQLTKGNFEVRDFIGIDEKSKMLYYTSTEVSPLEKHLYASSLDGRRRQKLSAAAGTHSINMSDDFQFYIDQHSRADQVPVTTLYRTKGNAQIKVLESNEKLAALTNEYGFSAKEFFEFSTSGDVKINGYMMKPKDFDASRSYPVLVYQYSGPGSQNAGNSWGGSHFFYHQMLTQKGYIVCVVDTRGTGSRGEKFKKVTYKQLGKYELEDVLQAAKYLQTLDFVDDSRIGIWGWSYGGYVSSLAMTKGAGVFKAGIAVAPVTNWRFYDTIYTERYLQTPQENASGYDDNSPLTYAGKLEGSFLLVHGTGDDNVHFQNSIVFQDALIDAGKKFQSMYYPDKAHSIAGGKTRLHLYTMMAEFIEKNL